MTTKTYNPIRIAHEETIEDKPENILQMAQVMRYKFARLTNNKSLDSIIHHLGMFCHTYWNDFLKFQKGVAMNDIVQEYVDKAQKAGLI